MMFANNTGLMWENAAQYRAMVVFVEHRYYGDSMPFGSSSFECLGKLGFLTVEQALADYADFLTWLKLTMPGAENSPVVAFGGSYGGMLAAYLRMKYPHIVIGYVQVTCNSSLLMTIHCTDHWRHQHPFSNSQEYTNPATAMQLFQPKTLKTILLYVLKQFEARGLLWIVWLTLQMVCRGCRKHSKYANH